MTVSSVLLFPITFVVLLASTIASSAVRVLRNVGVLPPGIVNVAGLLEDLFSRWPLENDERCEEEIVAEERAKIEVLFRAA